MVERRQTTVVWESFLFWPDAQMLICQIDCSSFGETVHVFTKRAGDAQTNDSTMTNEDNGFRKHQSADAEITDMQVTY